MCLLILFGVPSLEVDCAEPIKKRHELRDCHVVTRLALPSPRTRAEWDGNSKAVLRGKTASCLAVLIKHDRRTFRPPCFRPVNLTQAQVAHLTPFPLKKVGFFYVLYEVVQNYNQPCVFLNECALMTVTIIFGSRNVTKACNVLKYADP